MSDMSRMLTQELKKRIQSGQYKLEPDLIAESMLSRRSVRELLAPAPTVRPVGRTHEHEAARRQAA